MPQDASSHGGTRREARSEERRRLFCPALSGKETWVGDGLVKLDALGFVVGVIKDTKGLVEPPRALADDQVEALSRVRGLIELSAAEARRVPLEIENRRRHEEFIGRVAEAVHAARRTHRRWPTVREVQAQLERAGHPKGRKEKIATIVNELRCAPPASTKERS